MEEKEIEAKIVDVTNKLSKIDKKEANGKKLTKNDEKSRKELKAQLDRYNLMKSWVKQSHLKRWTNIKLK